MWTTTGNIIPETHNNLANKHGCSQDPSTRPSSISAQTGPATHRQSACETPLSCRGQGGCSPQCNGTPPNPRSPVPACGSKTRPGITVEQQSQKHPGMIRPLATRAVCRRQAAKIKAVDNLNHKPRQVILGKPVLHRWRQEKQRLPVHLSKVSRHHASPSPTKAATMTRTVKRSRIPGQETTHIRPDDGSTGQSDRVASNPTAS